MIVEELFRCLVIVVENYVNFCKGRLVFKKKFEKGYVVVIRFNCSMEKSYSLLWLLLLYLFNNEYFVNRRVMYGFVCSGMLLVYYMWFVKGVNIGVIN